MMLSAMFLAMVFIGKLLRWTLMKTVLVDTSSGHEIIQALISGGTAKRFAANAAVPFYDAINIFNIRTFVGYEIYLTVLLNIVLFALLMQINRKIYLIEFLFYALSVVVLNLFDFTLAKEPVQFLFFLAIFLVIKQCKKVRYIYLGVIFLLLICAASFRTYYYLVVLYFVILHIFFNYCKKKKLHSKKLIVISIIFFTILYFGILNIAGLVSVETYLELIRVRTRSSDARTGIVAWVNSNNLFVFSCNYCITALRMLIPIELLRFGPKYFMYVGYQLFITGFIVSKLKSIKNLSSKEYIALLLLIAFVLCSATFEPDFGSWIRHEALMFPVILILLGAVDVKMEEP